MSRQTYPAKFRYQGEVAKHYLQRRAGSLKWQREQQVVERLVERFPRGSSILDVPLGTGRFLQYYVKGNHIVYGLDISRDMLCQAQKLQTEVSSVRGLIQADAESMPLGDGAVDYVVCTRLMNWVPLPVFTQIISEFKRVARKGIVVEVRVRQPLGLLELIRNLGLEIVSSPRAIVRRLVRPLRSRVIATLSAVKRAFTGRASHISSNPGRGNAHRYVLHSADEVACVFEEQGLVVEDVALVDERTIYAHREFQPFLMYMLRPRDYLRDDTQITE